MRIFFRRILIFVLVAALFFTNINISVAASGIGKESFYQMKNEQEDTRQIENITTESQESTAGYKVPNSLSVPFFTFVKETPPPVPPPTLTELLLLNRGVKLYCLPFE